MPGDEIVAGARVVIDREETVDAGPELVWPWLIQLGKGRAGWYLPRRAERLLPRRYRALRNIDPAYQVVAAGDRVADFGPRNWFEARVVDPPHVLVWASEQAADQRLSWAFVVEPATPAGSRLRVRLRISQRPGRAPVMVRFGAGLVDRLTIRLLLAGLRERLAGEPPQL